MDKTQVAWTIVSILAAALVAVVVLVVGVMVTRTVEMTDRIYTIEKEMARRYREEHGPQRWWREPGY